MGTIVAIDKLVVCAISGIGPISVDEIDGGTVAFVPKPFSDCGVKARLCV